MEGDAERDAVGDRGAAAAIVEKRGRYFRPVTAPRCHLRMSKVEQKGMSGEAGSVRVEKLEGEPRPAVSPTVWRMRVWRDTEARSRRFYFETSRKWAHDPVFPKRVLFSETRRSVTPEDTLVAAQRLQQTGYTPAVLNFADNLIAGGNVIVGSGAQEESLWRRTNLCRTQLQTFYPLLGEGTGPVEGIYTPAITVFKSSESEGYVDLLRPWQVAIVSVPAIPYPLLERGRMGHEETAIFRKKIELVLQIANRQGHDSLVLGAFGCGAWRGPPQQIAELFREVLREWTGAFREVVFACLHREDAVSVRRGTYRGNYEIFRDVLG